MLYRTDFWKLYKIILLNISGAGMAYFWNLVRTWVNAEDLRCVAFVIW